MKQTFTNLLPVGALLVSFAARGDLILAPKLGTTISSTGTAHPAQLPFSPAYWGEADKVSISDASFTISSTSSSLGYWLSISPSSPGTFSVGTAVGQSSQFLYLNIQTPGGGGGRVIRRTRV